MPAGGAMVVDREGYAEAVTAEIENNPLIEVIREEITEIPDDALYSYCFRSFDFRCFSWKNSTSLTVEMGSISMMPLHRLLIKSTIDMNKVYLKPRHTRVKQLPLNCPMTKEESFHEA